MNEEKEELIRSWYFEQEENFRKQLMKEYKQFEQTRESTEYKTLWDWLFEHHKIELQQFFETHSNVEVTNSEEQELIDYPASLEDFDNEKFSEVYSKVCEYGEEYDFIDHISERLIRKFLETKLLRFLDHLSYVADLASGGKGADYIFSNILKYVKNQTFSTALWLKLKDIINSLEYHDGDERCKIQASAFEEKIKGMKIGRIIISYTCLGYDSGLFSGVSEDYIKTIYIIIEE